MNSNNPAQLLSSLLGFCVYCPLTIAVTNFKLILGPTESEYNIFIRVTGKYKLFLDS